jgi:hypothetical protein
MICQCFALFVPFVVEIGLADKSRYMLLVCSGSCSGLTR